MKRIVLLLLAVLLFTECRKSETLKIYIVNEYEEPVLVSGIDTSDESRKVTIRPSRIQDIAYCGISGPEEIEVMWVKWFYNLYNTITVYSSEGEILDTWSKGEASPRNPFSISNWIRDDKDERGVDGGIKEGIEYTFLVAPYHKKTYNLLFVLAPSQQ